MNKFSNLIYFLVAVSFLAVAATGIDLVTSRTGFGLLGLGAAGVLLGLLRLVKPNLGGPAPLMILTAIGGAYFIWRCLAVGPVGLAIPDLVLVLVFLGTYFAVSTSGSGVKHFLIFCLALLCVVNVGVALAQLNSGKTFYVWQDGADDSGFIGGLFGHYNAFASFLNGSVFFFLSYLFLGRNKAIRLSCGVLVIGMIAALILSGSRGGWVSLVAGGVVWMAIAIAYLKQRQSKMVGIAAIAAVVISVCGVVSSVWAVQKITEKRVEESNKELNRNAKAQVTDGGRFAFQQLAFEVFQDSPALGNGPRSFSYLSLEKWDPDELWLWMGVPEHAHNEYMQALADYGFVGLGIIMLLLLIHGILGVVGALSSEDPDDGLSIWQLGALGGLAAVLCQCFFSFLLHFPACMILVALQVGILASRSRKASLQASSSRFAGWCVGGLGIAVSLCLLGLGWVLTQSFLLNREAEARLTAIVSPEGAFRALDTASEAGLAGRDPHLFEIAGRRAMTFANEALESGDPDLAEKFNHRAKEAFENALKFHPRFAAGIAGLPRVHDALGNYEEAEKGHRKAMTVLWAREYYLKVHFFAAQSSYLQAVRAHQDDQREKALPLFRVAHERILRRREILQDYREKPEVKALRTNIEGWVAFYEARLLYGKGDDIWRNARPRNPGLAYGYLLEAMERYEACEKVVREKDARWEKQAKALQASIGFLEGAKIKPVKPTSEQIQSVLSPEAGLDSTPATR